MGKQKSTSVSTTMNFRSAIHAKVFRLKGTRFIHPVTNEETEVPGGEWCDGKEGTLYDYGELYSVEHKHGWLMWKLIGFRMWLEGVLKKLQGGNQ